MFFTRRGVWPIACCTRVSSVTAHLPLDDRTKPERQPVCSVVVRRWCCFGHRPGGVVRRDGVHGGRIVRGGGSRRRGPHVKRTRCATTFVSDGLDRVVA